MKTRLNKLLALVLTLTLLLGLLPTAGAVILNMGDDYLGTLKVGDVLAGGSCITYYLRDADGHVMNDAQALAAFYSSEEPNRNLLWQIPISVAGDIYQCRDILVVEEYYCYFFMAD